jgi:hypothetical protein
MGRDPAQKSPALPGCLWLRVLPLEAGLQPVTPYRAGHHCNRGIQLPGGIRCFGSGIAGALCHLGNLFDLRGNAVAGTGLFANGIGNFTAIWRASPDAVPMR